MADGHVIVGGGLAGAKAAQALRSEGFSGPVTILGSEPVRPYERPPLSKGWLLGTAELESAFVHPRAWYDENDVDLRLDKTVASLDRQARQVIMDGGEPLGYERLLLVTGSTPRPLERPGSELGGVHYLRTMADAEELKRDLMGAAAVAVIGGGWIGLEVAAAARTAGLPVTVLEQAELPLLRVLGPEVAAIFAGLHRSHGVDLRTGVGVEALEPGSDGRVGSVLLSDGEKVAADLVVVGVGITPNTGLAAAAGLQVDNGIVVDAALRTSDPAIFAAGDVANAFNPTLGTHLRVEHWDNARRQGAAAGMSMLDREISYDRLPFFYTDQYDVGMEYVGHVGSDGADEVVIRGDVSAQSFLAFWLSGGRVAAGMHVNVWDTIDQIRDIIHSRREVDPRRLADPEVPLDEV